MTEFERACANLTKWKQTGFLDKGFPKYVTDRYFALLYAGFDFSVHSRHPKLMKQWINECRRDYEREHKSRFIKKFAENLFNFYKEEGKAGLQDIANGKRSIWSIFKNYKKKRKKK